jgi:hypothetical protein
MSNKVKAVIILAVLAIILFVSIIILLNTATNNIEVGDEVYVVNESINNQAWIINGTVIEIKYQDNEIVEYSVLLPRNDVVIYRQQENVFSTYKQALKYVLNN